MARTDKLLAEWFWTDRWMGSSGFLLPMLARGLYREMLTQAWRRGAKLPNDPESVKRAVGATDAEWTQGWPLVSRFWRITTDNMLVNDTQLEVYAQAVSKQSVKAEAGRLGGLASQAKHRANVEQNTEQTRKSEANGQAKFNPPSPSPSPSPISDSVSVSEKNNKLTSEAVAVVGKNGSNGNGHVNGRSKRPIFQGQRFIVFDWMLEDMERVLGSNTEAFDLHEWFFNLDARAAKAKTVLPKDQQWPWLQAELVKEASKRGLNVHIQQPSGKQTAGQKMQAAIAQIDAVALKAIR